MALDNDQKRQWAQLLYTKERLTQKEIADKVGVSAVTVNRWVDRYDWKTIRDSYIMTKENELARVRGQLTALNDMIIARDPGDRFPTSTEADIQVKLSATIKNLTTEVEIDEIIDVSIDFLNWLKPIDFEKAQEVTELMDVFIQFKLKNRKA